MNRLSRIVSAVSLCCSLFVSGTVFAQDAGDSLMSDAGLFYRMHLPAQGSGGAPVVFLLHGMGSNEQDLMSLDSAFPDKYAVVSVRAPYELQPGSYEWYQSKVVDGTMDGDSSQLDMSAQSIDGLVTDLVRRYGFDRTRVYLVGFSQGAVMTYEVGLVHPRTYRGIGVMSGDLYGSLKPKVHPSMPLTKMKVFISHGDADQRIPMQLAEQSYETLMRLGVRRTEFHVYPGMGHEINSAALDDLVHWLKFDTPDAD